jgi:hypothetical protein
MPTTCGSFALANATAMANAKVIDKLLAAGLIIIAKANLTVRDPSSKIKYQAFISLTYAGMGQHEGAGANGGLVCSWRPNMLSNGQITPLTFLDAITVRPGHCQQ